MHRSPSLAFILAVLIPLQAGAGQAGEPRMLNGFETDEEVAAASPNGNRLQAVDEHATQGRRALRIEFQPGKGWPNASFAAVQPWDWHEWDTLVVDVSNPGTEMVEVGIGVGDASEAGGAGRWSSGTAMIVAGGTLTLGYPLGGDMPDTGMDALPSQVANCTMMHAYGDHVNLRRVALFTIFTPGPKTAAAIVVDNIRLASKSRLDGIVDQFGQYTGAEWVGKVHQATDLQAARKAEAADWAAHPVPVERDRFGGWAAGPQLPATGFFRTQKVDGKWWFVDPEGRLFFSLGMTTINHGEPSDQYTRVSGRENLFTWLPQPDAPLYHHISVRRDQRYFNFYGANLERKYSANYAQSWLDATKTRLLSWGFNTVGAFSSQSLYGVKLTYCVPMGAWGGHRTVKGGAIKIDDPYDPQFALDLASNLKSFAPNAPGDPYCLGYFVDNELTWGGSGSDRERYAVAVAVLGQGADSPAKKAFLNLLTKGYPDIAALNTRWKTQFANWEALGQPFTPGSWEQRAAMKADLSAYMKDFTTQYYRTVRETLKAYDPGHLYLGDKYMVSRYTPEALQAAAAYCDVISFDIYEGGVDGPKWNFLNELNLPCLIGEFHFGALDRGMFGSGMVGVANQAERSQSYQRYVRSVADHPAFVGCHWFQYVDEPLTARAFDRENHNVGFVNVCDVPYPELVTAARNANAEVYARRSRH